MTYFVKNIQTSDDLIKHQYKAPDFGAFAANVDFVMLKEGYRLINGEKGNGEYEKGNRTMRILFGAFVKYFKFSVKLAQANTLEIELLITKTSSGISGGLIGIGQVKTELRRLSQVFAGI